MHQSWKSLSIVLSAVLCGALLTGIVMSVPARMTSGVYADQIAASTQAKKNLDAAEGLSSAFRNVAEVLNPSVVSISTRTSAKMGQRGGMGGLVPGQLDQLPPRMREEIMRQFGLGGGGQMPGRGGSGGGGPDREGMGSGVIAREDGYILTNNHVIEGADELIVELSDGRKVEGKVVGTDPPTDLAVVKIEATGLKAAVFGDSDNIQVGDWVLAIGSPFGLDHTVTAGIISGKNRVQRIVADGQGFEDFLQTDAAINPGNSGGPLVNLRGELVGINTAILSRSGASAGIGFAIPVSMARPVLDSIIDSGSVRRGFLGVQVGNIDPDIKEEFALSVDAGGLIRSVVDGQPAAIAGLQPGDVVTKVDDKTIASGTQMQNVIASKMPGATVSLTVNRAGEVKTFTIKLEERTTASLAAFDGQRPGEAGPGAMGAKLEPLTPELARDLGIDESTRGLVITDLRDGSWAATKGFAVGDVIEQVNGSVLTDTSELDAATREVTASGYPLRMIVRRGDSRLLIVVSARDLAGQ